jgi:cation transport ATPase
VVHALEGLPGVIKAEASHPEKRAVVIYDQSQVSIEQMRQALLKAGYAAHPKAENSASRTADQDESLETRDHRMEDLICYCFEYTKADIEQDFIANGRSLIMEKIAAEKKSGTCDCANKNPKGR